ncbi:MAG: tRNA threonylcarbamoyladenosine biosynthesis protein TsaB [Chthoniobacterales bacterium]
MKILAMEISTLAGSIAVAEGGRLVAERRFACDRGRGSEVFAALAATRPAWKGAEIIAVGIGPGSYNGLRISCAIAASLQMATGAAIRISPSPCLLPTEETHFLVCGDARGGRAWCAEVRRRRLCGEVALLPYEEVGKLAGGALPVWRTGPLPGGEEIHPCAPEAAVLALLAPDLPTTEVGRIEPIYLKPPHITMPRQTAP